MVEKGERVRRRSELYLYEKLEIRRVQGSGARFYAVIVGLASSHKLPSVRLSSSLRGCARQPCATTAYASTAHNRSFQLKCNCFLGLSTRRLVFEPLCPIDSGCCHDHRLFYCPAPRPRGHPSLAISRAQPVERLAINDFLGPPQPCNGRNLHRRPALCYELLDCNVRSVRCVVGHCTCFRPAGAASALLSRWP